MAKLKSCPFCGKIPLRKKVLTSGYEYICCDNPKCQCQPSTDAYKSKGAAARAWNRRVDNG